MNAGELLLFVIIAVVAIILIRFFRRSASGRGGSGVTYCTKCGAANDSTAQYCGTCQALLSTISGYQPMQSVNQSVGPTDDSPVQIRIDSDKSSASQKAASPEVITEVLRVPKAPAPPPAARSSQIIQTLEKDSSAQPPSDLHVDKNVQFTVYRPNTIVPNKWYPLVAFAHLSKRRSDAPKDEPDPVEEVRRQAARILLDQAAQYEQAKLDRGFSVPRRGLLTFVPLIEGCEFNPPTQSVLWQKTVHKIEFEMTASPDVDGKEVEGQMTVYLGNIVLTEVPLRINVDSQYVAATSQPAAIEEANAEPYRKIFASYSHKDTEIVEDFEAYVQALGDQYLRDVQTLRSGEVWSEALERMIREATVFQLFWSSNSMRSKFVKQEWEYALRLNKPGFIRPVYWEEPLPQIDQNLPPAELRRLHFYKFPEIIQSAPAAADLKDTLSVGSAQGPASHNYCTKCGALNDSTAQYCVSCQAPLSPVGGYQPMQSVTLDASQVTLGGNERAVPNPPVPALGASQRFIVPMKSLLALVAFVAVGSVAFLGYLNIYSGNSTNYNANSNSDYRPTPTPEVTVVPETKLRLLGDSGEYSLVVGNPGSEAIREVRITENLPNENLEFVNSDPKPVSWENPQVIVWRVAEISGNNNVTIKIAVRLKHNLQPGRIITTTQTVVYIDHNGRERTADFSVELVVSVRPE